ncbi:hypothetical protein C8R46DRAFT_478893 [Mycena filopes]|nr:hypothetical protein C8R46DRAFT_478893 [Mycena filopes]
MSLMLTLPPEITSEIFVHCLSDYPEFPPLYDTTQNSPLALCRICHAWRDVALATPRLWRAIDITIDSRSGAHLPQMLSLLQLWLARSGDGPLSLRLIIWLDSSLPVIERFCQTLAPHRHRLQNLVLDAKSEHLDFLRGAMPLLRDLTLGWTHSNIGERTDLFDQIPRLRNLVLQSFDRGHMQLPLAQLTSIDVQSLYTADCVNILRAAPNLLHCRFSILEDLDHIPNAIPAHHNLRHLILDMEEGLNDSLVVNLTLPALRTLKLYENGATHAALTAFISRSQCRLDELCITEATLTEAAYREALPSIRVITVEIPDWS